MNFYRTLLIYISNCKFRIVKRIMTTVEYKQFLGKALEYFLLAENVFSILANYVRKPYEYGLLHFVDPSHRTLIW